MQKEYLHSKAPFSLKTNEQKEIERKRMDFHCINFFISLFLMFTLPIISVLLKDNYTAQWVYWPVIFMVLFVLIISSWKFSIKLLVVMVKLKRWDYFIISIITGSLTSFICYFIVYRPFLKAEKSLEEISSRNF